MRAKPYLTASLAVVMLAATSITGCSSQKSGMGKTPESLASGSKVMQMWRCELDDGATEEQVTQGAQDWLAAARTMKGGKNLDLFVNYPVAVNATGQVDMVLMLTAPSFKEWGQFWDGYADSPAADIEEASEEFVICPDSTLWEAYKLDSMPIGPRTAVALQMWRCEMNDGATEEQVLEASQEWLAAAHSVAGGENLEFFVNYPVAVNATNQVDMIFMILAPSFEEWGEFWDAYPDSPAADAEAKGEKFVVCPDSVLWEANKVMP